MKGKVLFVLTCMLLTIVGVFAQDIHYSQYYASPLTLNPSLTGKFNGLYRVSAIYRDQWRTTNTDNQAYLTPSVSLDFSLLKHKLKNDALGVGVVVLYDKIQALETLKAGASIAYHKGLDKNGKYNLSLGIQGNYINRKIGDDLNFEDEILSGATISAEEFEQGRSFNTGDINAGLFFDGRFTDWMTFYAGYSFFNIMKHKDDFISTGDVEGETAFRHVIHGGFEFEIAKKWLIIPGALYQTTVKTREVNFGSTFGYKLTSSKQKVTTLLLGGWYRLETNSFGNNGAAIIKGGIDFQNFRVTGAYDIGLAQLREDAGNALSKKPNAFEIAVSYFGGAQTAPKTNTYLFNPRF